MAILNIWINILLKILDNNISINRQNSMVGIFLRKIRDKMENIISVRIKIRLEVDYYKRE